MMSRAFGDRAARQRARVLLVITSSAVLVAACGGHGTTTSESGSTTTSTSTGQGTGGAGNPCPPCQEDSDCATGSKCGQFGGTTYCAPDCTSATCATGRACTPVNGANGVADKLCLPVTNVCGGTLSGSGGSGGAGTGGASASNASSSSSSSSGVITGTVGPKGGSLSLLNFAIVGDTRPAAKDDTAGYPTATITTIWKDIEAHVPRPSFAVTTGDYMFASPTGKEAAPQLAKYLKARSNFSNVVFPALGNHECTGGDASECGTGNPDGNTTNFTTFMDEMIVPLGQSEPYYVIDVESNSAAPKPWTAKFVVVACNAWTSKQSTWLTTTLAKPTTYTFVIRHEGSTATTVPCIAPSAKIIAAHPLTLLIVGHTHTYTYDKAAKEVIVGVGGAPLSGSQGFGYVIASQQPSGDVLFQEFAYDTNKLQHSFTVAP